MAKAKTAPQEKKEQSANLPAQRNNTSVGQKLDFAKDAGAGFENAGAAAFAVPFLTILQSGSPQCKRSDAAYIKGATEGMIFNTVTNEVFNGDEGVEIIQCAFTNTFVEWTLRESGGGFVTEYDLIAGQALRAKAHRDDKNRDILPNGHQLNDNRNHYVLFKDSEGQWQPALMSLTSTGIKASRNWMSNMQRKCIKDKVPTFALRYSYTTMAQKNEKGTWYGPVFSELGFVDDQETYDAAKAFYAQVQKGEVKAPTRETGPEGSGAGEGSTDNPDDM